MASQLVINQTSKNTDPSSQRSPHWMLSFVRYQNRAPSKFPNQDPKSLEKTLVVISDCMSLQITEKKDGYSSTLVAVLKGGDVNYLTAIGTGDYIIANIVNGPDKIQELYGRASAGQGINRYSDGFKGVFKIHGIRRRVQIDPSNGSKIVSYVVIAYSHQELNNTIYFIPQLITPGEKDSAFLFYSAVNKNFQKYISDLASTTEVQNILQVLLDSFLGTAFNGNQAEERTPNSIYYIPNKLANLLSLSGNRSVDVNNILLGVQKYKDSSAGVNIRANPADISRVDSKDGSTKGRVWVSKTLLKGQQKPTVDQLNSIKVGDLIKQRMHAELNEMYVCHRVDPVSQIVLPTIVIREKPFTTNEGLGATRFRDLPYWNIPSEVIYDLDIGKDDSGRINFVQLYGQNTSISTQVTIGDQIARKNWVEDKGDIELHGLKPYVMTSNFDYNLAPSSAISQTPEWVKIIADWIIGSHLKLNGSITTSGIFEPIVPGDNARVQDVLLHIESVSHNCQQNMDGTKIFRTTINLSHGVEFATGKITDESSLYAENRDGQRDALLYAAYNPNMPVPSHEDFQGNNARTRVNRVVKVGSVDLDRAVQRKVVSKNKQKKNRVK